MSRVEPQEELQVRERLRALRVDPPVGDFEAALHRRLAAAGPPDEPGLWQRLREATSGAAWLWPLAGVVAGLMVVLAFSLRPAPVAPVGIPVAGRLEPAAPEAPPTEVPASKVAIVRLNLTTEVAAANAEIQVNLPDGLVFWSHGEALAQRSFSWTQALATGDNDIPIAIRGQRPGRYRVAVTARTGSEQVQDEVVLEVTNG